VILEGRYVWVPFCRIKRVNIERPADLRDLVWAPAQFVWTNGGEASGHIPGRYPQTEKSADGALRLARKTDWSTTKAASASVWANGFWSPIRAIIPCLNAAPLIWRQPRNPLSTMLICEHHG